MYVRLVSRPLVHRNSRIIFAVCFLSFRPSPFLHLFLSFHVLPSPPLPSPALSCPVLSSSILSICFPFSPPLFLLLYLFIFSVFPTTVPTTCCCDFNDDDDDDDVIIVVASAGCNMSRFIPIYFSFSLFSFLCFLLCSLNQSLMIYLILYLFLYH